jgi:hypothetical protein
MPSAPPSAVDSPSVGAGSPAYGSMTSPGLELTASITKPRAASPRETVGSGVIRYRPPRFNDDGTSASSSDSDTETEAQTDDSYAPRSRRHRSRRTRRFRGCCRCVALSVVVQACDLCRRIQTTPGVVYHCVSCDDPHPSSWASGASFGFRVLRVMSTSGAYGVTGTAEGGLVSER